MENVPTQPVRLARFNPFLKVLLVLTTGAAFVLWWVNTPPGLLGKASAAAYAVCHRIAERSFHIGVLQMPLCARCTGMYLGALLGLLYLARYGKRNGMPPLKILIVLGFLLAAFGLDGANSYLHFFPGATGLYQPQNWLRLVTGTGVGLGIASILFPVINQVLWQNSDKRAALEGWKQFFPLIGLAVLLDLAVLSDIPLLLYPLGILSAGTIFLVLTLVYAIVWVMAFKKDNHFQRYRDLWVPLLVGFLTALVQIGLFDIARFWLTGTWAGFQL